MGHHFCEQDTHAQISRRTALKGILASTGISVFPASAEAAMELTDEAQLDACLEQLVSILARMFPTIKEQPRHYLWRAEDGSFRLDVRGDVAFQPFDGDGLYEISMDGYLMTYWLEKRQTCRISDGTPIPGLEHYMATQCDGGEYVDEPRRLGSVNIVRKLSGGAA